MENVLSLLGRWSVVIGCLLTLVLSAVAAPLQTAQSSASLRQQFNQALLLGPLQLHATAMHQAQSQQQLAQQKPAAMGTLDFMRTQWQMDVQGGGYQASFTATLLTPSTQRQAKAVLLLHDHGAEFRIGQHKYLPPDWSAEPALVQRWQQKYFDAQPLALLLVQQGFTVLLADAPGFGERGALEYTKQQQLAANYLAQGFSLAGIVAREDQALAKWLNMHSGLPVVAVGFSMGGFRALQVAALSDDVHAAVSMSWFNSLQFLRQPGNNFSRGQTAFYFIHPGLYQQADLPDLWALALPKPLLILSGDEDPLMPPHEVQVAFDMLNQHRRSEPAANASSPCLPQAPQLHIVPKRGHHAGLLVQQQLVQFLSQLHCKS